VRICKDVFAPICIIENWKLPLVISLGDHQVEIGDRQFFSSSSVLNLFVQQPRRRKLPIKTSSCFWKDADPDIPILKQAKAEYPKLQ